MIQCGCKARNESHNVESSGESLLTFVLLLDVHLKSWLHSFLPRQSSLKILPSYLLEVCLPMRFLQHLLVEQ